MNRNTIISLAMLYALWQSKRQDLLDLITPFILYTVGITTKVSEEIKIESICTKMEAEFGYKAFQPAVVRRVLHRETSSDRNKNKIIKKNGKFYLVEDYSNHIENFSEKRTKCKSHTDYVTKALVDFFNEKEVYNRKNYTQADAEMYLLSFFERQGGAIVDSIEDLRQITAKNNEINYYVGKFILAEYEKKSVLWDYIQELVKGYFVTTAIYLQAENPNITTASFSDVTFYLDTRLLLAFLGYKTKEENDSVQKMISSLKRSGAKLACFSYNIDEVNNILEAYKLSTISRYKRISAITLEYFDENDYSSTHVESAQRRFKQRLEIAGIICYYPDEALEKNKVETLTEGLLDDIELKNMLLSIKPNYNVSTLPDDLTAINTISRIRGGNYYPNIEGCKAVFVTSNSLLVAATKHYLKESGSEVGFPLVITGEDLCVLAWLKDFEQDNTLPQMRLLENVLAAISPTKELMEAYFSHLEYLEQEGLIGEDEAILLRVDTFVRNDLMEMTRGEKENLSSAVIDCIREKVREDAYRQGQRDSKQKYELQYKEKINAACEKAELEVEAEFASKEKGIILATQIIGIFFAILLVIASVLVFLSQVNSSIKWALSIVTVVSMIQAVVPFLYPNRWIVGFVKRKMEKMKLKKIDERKEHYMSLIR